ncbi:MAG TPA: helix-turn-helix domain-containing protein [Thermoanaerobaculia bacterium]|nr:helix-turn-helix domain-containing protein [Thermoanaerobaculia bacterium]
MSRHTGGAAPDGRQGRFVLVGQRLRRLRKERRLTVAELCARAGIQTADQARIEKGEGRMSLDVLFRVLAALQVDGVEFFAAVERELSAPRESKTIREL